MLQSVNDMDCIALATCEAASIPPQDRGFEHEVLLHSFRLVANQIHNYLLITNYSI